MTRANPKTCTCGGDLGEIRLIDKAHYGAHSNLEYSAANTKRSFWRAGWPIEGRIRAWVCSSCGQVHLFAEPKSK